jgi:hypothetical protein
MVETPPGRHSNRVKYEEIIEAYDLEILQRPADWGFDGSGDLLLTEDGNPQVGDQIYNAMYRLVVRWSCESPTISVTTGGYESTTKPNLFPIAISICVSGDLR